MLRVQFPTGCKPVTSDLEEHELEKRLKVLSEKLAVWRTSDSKSYQIYETLAYHLANERLFLANSNKTIQLCAAICHSNIFRVFYPMSPFSNTPYTLFTVLRFLIDHLKPLKDPSSPFYEESECILANLTRSNAFALCSNFSEISTTHRILQRLIAVLFDIIDKNSQQDIYRLISILITNLINSPRKIVEGVLPFIFLNLTCTSNKTVHKFSEKILLDSKRILQPLLAQDFLKILINITSHDVLDQVHPIISGISSIYPEIQSYILPQLITLLKSSDYNIKSKAVVILFELLQNEHSENYWKLFLSNFSDKNEKIRIICLEGAKIFLLDCSTRDEIIELLKLVQRDCSPQVRAEVITTIVSAAEEEPELLSDQGLLSIIKERGLDKDYVVRKHTLKQLSSIIHSDKSKALKNFRTPDVTKSVMSLIVNEVVCGYYIEDERDRMYVEKILNTWFMNFHAEVQDRMMTLYYVFTQLNDDACRAFTALQIHRFTIRKCLIELFESRRELRVETDELRVKELEKLAQKQLKLFSKFFPRSIKNPAETEVNLQKFFEAIDEDPSLAEDMKTVLQPNVTCAQSEDLTNTILSKIGDLDTTDPYYNTVRTLLERSCLMVIDETAVRVLIGYLKAVLRHNHEIIEDIGLDSRTAAKKGFKLLEILSFSSAPYFIDGGIYHTLVSFLKIKNPSITVNVLHILTNIGKLTALDKIPSTWTALEEYCKSFIISGTTEEAKAAVKLMCGQPLFKDEKILKVFLENIEACLMDPFKESRTAIASLGYIAWFGEGSDKMIYGLIKRVYMKVLRFYPDESGDKTVKKAWSEKKALPLGTICRLEAMKCVTRWVISRSVQESWIIEIIRLLMTFISQNGNVDRLGNFRADEKSWLRLQAGACLLKLCRFEKIGDKLEPKQFYELSKLMLDDVYEVRKGFHLKLKRGLSRNCSTKCLPIDFMGFFVLGGLEKDKDLREGLKRGMIMQIRKSKKNLMKLMRLDGLGETGEKVLENIKPECAVIYAVVILVHWKGKETNWDKELVEVKRGVEFVMDYWFEGDGEEKEQMFRFFKLLMQRLRVCRDALTPDDDLINSKIRTVCDVAICYLENDVKTERGVFGEGDGAVLEPQIPKRYLLFDEELLRKSGESLSKEILMERLKNIEKGEKEKETKTQKKKEKKVINKIDLQSSFNAIFGVSKRTKRRKSSALESSSTKRRKLRI
ncbi:sister chromatid cohesion protein PDS5 homolog A [Diachasma alloeum]|uniref:sister chromatid cohesion protein PDS5 homolog A n=1 Tax=Diachasma alloeum TaxID=454923 RepID=UPI0007381437|nr:sister chromatid cohesion protein PDS5 homolog A [Diachasma alloeum]